MKLQEAVVDYLSPVHLLPSVTAHGKHLFPAETPAALILQRWSIYQILFIIIIVIIMFIYLLILQYLCLFTYSKDDVSKNNMQQTCINTFILWSNTWWNRIQ